MTHYLIHIFCPVAKGTEEQCNKMRDKLIEKGNNPKQLAVWTIAEYEAILESNGIETKTDAELRELRKNKTEVKNEISVVQTGWRGLRLFDWLRR